MLKAAQTITKAKAILFFSVFFTFQRSKEMERKEKGVKTENDKCMRLRCGF